MQTGTETRALLTSNLGSNVAGELLVGTITLPAEGPWELLYAFAVLTPRVANAAELIGGHVRLSAVSGDVVPNMAPLKIPTSLAGSFLGALTDPQCAPLVLHPLNMTAAGKAVIEFYHNQYIACTTQPWITTGLIIGKERKEQEPQIWMDALHAGTTLNTKLLLGTITLSESATRIVGISAQVAQDGVLVAGEELYGFVVLESDDVKLQPLQLPCSMSFGAGLGATIASPVMSTPVWIPVDIEVPGGARIDVSSNLVAVITNAAEVTVTIAYR